MALPLAMVLLAPHAAYADPSVEMAAAREAFRSGQYEQAIPVLGALLYPTPRLAGAAELAEAHLLLGVCYLETGQADPATREFDEALFIDDTLNLDPLLFSEQAVQAFAVRKKNLEDKKRADAEARDQALKDEAFKRAWENMVVVEKRDYWVNFVPFGAGQFQNGQRGKGYFFFASQMAFGATSVGLFAYLYTRYNLQQGGVKPEEADRVRNLQILQVSAGAACLGLMAWGIVDSLAHYQPSTEGKPDRKYLDSILKKKKSKPSSFRWSPALTPDGLSAAVTWEF